MKKLTLFLIAMSFTGLATAQSVSPKSDDIISANGKLKATVKLVDQKMVYSVSYNERVVMPDMHLAMTFSNGVVAGENIKSKPRQKVRIGEEEIIPAVRIKTEKINVRYAEKTYDMGKYQIIFRVYDDAVANRFVTNFKENEIRVMSENVTYNFANKDQILFPEEVSFHTHQERRYINTQVDSIGDGRFCSPPMLVTDNKVRMLITEVDLESYPGIYYRKNGTLRFSGDFPHYPLEETKRNDRNLVVTKYADYLAVTTGNRSYPWRVALVTDEDTRLLESTTLYALASPSRIEDPSWIRPGKIAWDWWNGSNISGVDFEAGVNTKTYKYFIDFASKHGLEYIVFDEGWYDIKKTILDVVPEIDMEELIAYGKQRNVEIILWTTWLALEERMDEAMEQFKKWGVAGLKIDFMQRDDQKMVEWYYSTVKRAAELKLLVDYHGSYKPTGLSRTYPNMMTSEGVYGGEQNKWIDNLNPDHNVTLPFIRMVAGPMDYTPGAMRNATQKEFIARWYRPMSLGTRCHQLGMYVIYESPLQMLCDRPTEYEKEPEMMRYLGPVPSAWDETVALKAAVGDYVVMARRSGSKWYLGAMNDWTPRKLEISLDFLDEGEYKMESWADGVNITRDPEDYSHKTTKVQKGQKFTLNLASGGGFAAVIEK